jgi:hypothetical protein
LTVLSIDIFITHNGMDRLNFNLLEVMSASVYTGLNPFNFIRKHSVHICVRKVAVHLYKVLEVISTSVSAGLNPFNFIRKHFLQIYL